MKKHIYWYSVLWVIYMWLIGTWKKINLKLFNKFGGYLHAIRGILKDIVNKINFILILQTIIMLILIEYGTGFVNSVLL